MTNAVKQKIKYSGVEYLGHLPDNWQVIKTKYLCYVKGRIGFHGLNSEEFSDDVTLPYLVTGTDFIDQQVNWETCYHISDMRYEEDLYIQLREDDLLITKDGTIGKTAIVKNKPEKATLNSGIMVVRPNDKLLSEFLKYILNSNYFTYFIDLQYQGSTIKHLYQDTFNNFQIALPSIKDQKAIIGYLDGKTEQIKKFTDDKKKLINLLQEQKRTIIYYAVTKGIDCNLKTKPSGVNWLGDIPKDWGVLKLKHGVKLNIHKSVDCIDKNIALENIEGWTGKLIDTDGTFEGEGNLFKSGDILFGKLRPYLGKVYLSEYSGRCVNEILVFTPNKDMLNSEYLYYICSSSEFIKIVDSSTYGSKMPRAEWDFIGKMEVPIPDIETQKEIVNYIKKSTKKIDQAIHTVQKEIELIEEYKKSLIYQAVTGKIEALLKEK